MTKYRILAMDGGNGGNTAILLRDIQQGLRAHQKDFLNHIDLFAGTSAGGVNALFFAKHDDPTEALEGIFQFDKEIIASGLSSENPFHLVGAAVGCNALLATERLRAFYLNYFGETTRLGDLKKRVLIVSFQLDNRKPPPNQSWKPKIYNNFDGDPDCNELVVDVAFRTTALPTLYPIYQALSSTGPGFVDGAVVANNPAMIALAQMLNGRDLNDLFLLSVGTGRNIVGNTVHLSPEFKDGMASWGYRQWLFDPADPLVLLDLIVQSSAMAITYQCQHLLKDQFHRLNPVTQKGFVRDDPETERQVRETVSWLSASGWFDGRRRRSTPVRVTKTPTKKKTIEKQAH